MYFHVFAFRWKPEATEALQQRATEAILAFQGNIEGLIDVHVGQNDSPRGQGYAFVGVMRFTDRAAMEAYNVHPLHLELLEWLVPLIEAVELDFLPIG
jgi:Stress responsive A/B Barrel Domain